MLFACYFSQINQNKNIRVGIHKQERIYFLYSIFDISYLRQIWPGKSLVATERFIDSWSKIEGKA